jgi:hypothetical protein
MPHFVVGAAACQNNLGMVAGLLGPISQVIRIDADAVATDNPGLKGKEIPFGSCCRERVATAAARVDIECLKLSDSSFMNAMLRSRWVFSITFAASATWIEGVR